MKIIFFPIFETAYKLNQYVQRATWYLYPLRKYIKKIDFFSTIKCLDNFKSLTPDDLIDKQIKKYLDKFDALNINTCGDSNDALIDFSDCDYVFVSDEESRARLIKIKNKSGFNFEIVRVDHDNVQYADSFFLRFAEKIAGLHAEYRKISKERINKYIPPLSSNKVYLFGTGPNFECVKNHDFSDGLVIACNSMVINEEIINKLSPKLFVIADPIFHAGPSSYAGSFRESFLKVLGNRDCPVVVPMRDYHIYSTYLPEEIVDRLIPIEFKNQTGENVTPCLDVSKDYFVTTTSNILTLFQLPLAATLGNEIYISGCDGRPLTHNNYFWAHNKAVQINDKMADIKAAHPAFFNISYDDYYSKHIETLESWIVSIEDLGKSVSNLTPSYIPALQSRTVDTLIQEQKSLDSPELSIIIPLYRAEQFIDIAVNSIVNACKYSYEIIIVDDFSDDNSLSVAKEIAEKNSKVKVFQNFYKKGVSGARNTGIKIASGSAICFLDADDFVFENSINSRYETLISSHKIKIVHSTVKFFDAIGNDLGVEVGVKRTINFKDCVGSPTHFNTLMFKREVLGHLHFDENLTNGEDWLAISKMLRLGFVSTYVPDGGAAYRIHPESTVIKDFKSHEENLMPVLDWLYSSAASGEASLDYCGALKNGTKENAVASRKLNVLIMSILGGPPFNVSDFVSDINLVTMICDPSLDLTPRLRVPFVRRFSKNISKSQELENVIKIGIKENLLKLNDCIPKNRLGASIVSFLNLNMASDDGSLTGLSLRDANSLFQKGLYCEAKVAYESLVSRSGFYNFLSTNIYLCDKKIIEASKLLWPLP